MCVIIGFDNEVEWSKVEPLFRRAIAGNPDGAGLAWPYRGAVQWKKGMHTLAEVYAAWKRADGAFPRLFHARIATVGGTGDELTHPFPITHRVGLNLQGVAPRVLAHNGHWGSWQLAKRALALGGMSLPPGDWSDSRLLAFLINRLGKGAISEVSGQKIAILTPVKIHYLGDTWVDDKPTGAKLSNSGPLYEWSQSYDDWVTDYYHRHSSRDSTGWKSAAIAPRPTVRRETVGTNGYVWRELSDGSWECDYTRPRHPSKYVDVLTSKEREQLERYGAVVIGEDTPAKDTKDEDTND